MAITVDDQTAPVAVNRSGATAAQQAGHHGRPCRAAG
jgi:hypothetical protein